MGLEGDMTASSRCMTFMERSSYSEAIELNQNFVTGLWASNNYLDQRVTWEAAAFRPDKAAATGAFFGDDQWGFKAVLRPCRSMRMKAGTCCTSAYPAAGGPEGTLPQRSPKRLSCRRGPNCVTTTPPAPLAVSPTATG